MVRAILMATLLASTLGAADIYVATTGSDTTGTGAIGAPYATPRYAAQVANAGDVIILRGGTYAGNYVEIQDDNLTLKSYTGENARITMPTSGTTSVVVWIYNTGARLENLEIEGGSPYCIHVVPNCNGAEIVDCKIHGSDWIGIKVSGPDNVKLRRCEIYNTGSVTAGGMGIDCVNGDNILIEDCHFHDCNGTGIYLKGGLRNALVQRNLVRNVQGDGILLGESTGVAFMDLVGNPLLYEAIDGVVRNNIIVNASASGLITFGSLNCRWYNNTIYNCATGTGGAGLRLIKGAHSGYPDTPCKNGQFRNNIIVVGQASRPFVHVTDSSHDGSMQFNYNRYFNLGTANGVFWDELVIATAAYNLSLAQWTTRTGFDANSTAGDPSLNTTTFHLNAGSPCENAASAVTGFTDDYDGNTRSGVWDIGADETGGTALPTPPPAGTIGTGGGVAGPAPPTITTSSLGFGIINTAFNATVVCTGGTAPYTWSVLSGTLPPGLTLDVSSTGPSTTLSGTPTATGNYAFTLQVSGGGIATRAYTFDVDAVVVDPPIGDGGSSCSTGEWQALGLALALLALVVWAAREASRRTA